MASFAYLKCFNDLLLKKMERLEKENKELKEQKEKASRIERSYNSLKDYVNNCDNEIVQCEKCDDWDHFCEMQYFWDRAYCEDCSQDYIKCCWCGNAFNLKDKVDKTLFIYDADAECYCKDDEDCMEQYEKAMVRHWKNKYDDVMDELIKESNIERHYKLLHKQKYRDVINSLPRKCWCGKHIIHLWDCDTCFYDGEKSDTDSDAF